MKKLKLYIEYLRMHLVFNMVCLFRRGMIISSLIYDDYHVELLGRMSSLV